MVGSELFAEQLRAEDYDVTELRDGHVKIAYEVPVGKHAGLPVEIGFVVPTDFPLTPPSGPHIHKIIHPNKSDGEHPTGHIHPSQPNHSKHFGPDWQYWSRPFPNWASGAKNAVRYLEFIRRLWATQ